MLSRDSEDEMWKICVWTCDMTSRSYFFKMNSTLGSVVPLAMFFVTRPVDEWMVGWNRTTTTEASGLLKITPIIALISRGLLQDRGMSSIENNDLWMILKLTRNLTRSWFRLAWSPSLLSNGRSQFFLDFNFLFDHFDHPDYVFFSNEKVHPCLKQGFACFPSFA